MKKFLLSLIALFGVGTYALADEVTIPEVQIRLGHAGTAELMISISSGAVYKGVTFDMLLPEGLNVETKTTTTDGVTENNPFATTGESGSVLQVQGSFPEKDNQQHVRFAGFMYSIDDAEKFTDGCIVKVNLFADKNKVNVGDVLHVEVSDVHISTSSGAGADEFRPADFTFDVVIMDPYITLLDTETEVPNAATNEDVRVVRTIKADVWNTICLPFSMTEAQVVSAFGEDVQIADFIGCEGDVEQSGKPTQSNNVKVKFESATSILANHPYLIKVSETLDEFFVEGVDIDPKANTQGLVYLRKDKYDYDVQTEDEWGDPIITTQTAYNTFVGTFKANTTIGKRGIYLSNNQFMSSTGSSYVNAFRGYFDFRVTYINPASASNVKFNMTLDDATASENVDDILVDAEGWYDMSGRKLNNKPTMKGVYINNGKKQLIK